MKRELNEEQVLRWRKDVKELVRMLGINYGLLSDELGLARSSMSSMMSRSDNHLTVMQYLAVLDIFRYLVKTADIRPSSKVAAQEILKDMYDGIFHPQD